MGVFGPRGRLFFLFNEQKSREPIPFIAILFPHHALHLPGAAGAVPHEPWIVHVFVRHLGLVAVLVVQVVALLAFHQLVSHRHRHLPEAAEDTAG